jgi:hypothetical protein
MVPDVVFDLPLDVLADAGRDGIRATGARVDALGIVTTAAVHQPLQRGADEVVVGPTAQPRPFVGSFARESLVFDDQSL